MAQQSERTERKEDLPECYDSYLRYAIAVKFKNFAPFGKGRLKLFLLVEFKSARLAERFAREIKHDVDFGPGISLGRFASLRTSKAAVTDPETFPLWELCASKVELSLPVMPSLVPSVLRGPLRPRWQEGKDSPGSLLLGMLDDGCPFAAAHFLRSPGSTRVRGIWDQNRGRSPIEIKDSNGNSRYFGQTLTDFDYGLEFRRDFALPSKPAEIGLDDWIGLHSASGTIDEDGCYANAGFRSLSHRRSHGAHVMDVLAGHMPTSSRIGPARKNEDRRDPPSWKAGTDPASSADLVFVQFSDECIRDATGVWLKAYVFDGIRYILSFADPVKTKKVIINISYGPTTGPHDGTAGLEAVLRAFVKKFNGKSGNPKLEIVLPAGNAYLSEGHVAFTRQPKQSSQIEWSWRLPPDNSVLCFAEVWMDKAKPGSTIVTLTSPSGIKWTSATAPKPPPANAALPPYTGVYAPGSWGNHTRWLLAVEPTRARKPTLIVPEHGDWKIRVTGIAKNAQIHAYVARSDPNMGVRTGARLSYFVDHTWEQTKSSEASCTYTNGEFDRTGSLIHRGGTLNGIATAKDSRVHVAGGYLRTTERKAAYSSAGPARTGPLTLRKGPDYALLSDESHALRGIRARGNRSGSVFRLIGTSAAAPQLARHLADPPIPSPSNQSTQPDEIAKRGKGNLEPP